MKKDLYPIVAASLANDVYSLIHSSTVGAGYTSFYNNNREFLDLPPPDTLENGSSETILKGTTGAFYFLKARTAFGITAFGSEKRKEYYGHSFIVFRGTNTAFASDILTDATAGITQRSAYGHPVHNGFSDCFKSMKPQINRFLDESERRGVKIVNCIGHSLGGAVATLCSEYIKATRPTFIVKNYTFGSPRVGVKSFADSYTRSIGSENNFRTYHRTDIIPCIPCWPFIHVPTGKNVDDYFIPSAGNFAALDAHDMELYRNNTEKYSAYDWGTLAELKKREFKESNIEDWINKKSTISFTPTNLELLDKAINYVLSKVISSLGNILGGMFTGAITLLDQMAYIISRGVDLSKNISTLVLSLLRKICQMLGMNRTLEAADATIAFIRSLFQSLQQRVYEHVRKVLDAVLVNGQSL